MFPVYEEKKENLHFRSKTSRHASPHLHNSIEFIYITEGTLELGMGQELFSIYMTEMCSAINEISYARNMLKNIQILMVLNPEIKDSCY